MDVHLINCRLTDTYGKDFLNQPIYRIVWSETQIEKRYGTFRDYVNGTNIFIREVTEVRECKKYPGFEPQWCLEKLFRNQHNKEILDNNTLNPSSCTYEPMWMFGYENGRARQPIWRAVELIIISINNPEKLTPSQMTDKELQQAYKDEQLMSRFLDENVKNDAFHSSVKDGDTILMNDATSPRKS